ncbi:MAG: Maf family nucleotide pyrophosphatase [Pseudomonadota bacterium]
MTPLILASSSPYRQTLLDKLGLDFQVLSPNIDESALDGETPEDLVKRLALAKAKAVATEYSGALIIGSDQVAIAGDEAEKRVLTKPHNHQNAVEQLRYSSGKNVSFLTSLCLYNSRADTHQLALVPFSVEFLELSDRQINAYLQKEQPYNCAGSFKSEGLGITLFKRMTGDDPNSLIGLPLIALSRMLRNEGIEPLFQ